MATKIVPKLDLTSILIFTTFIYGINGSNEIHSSSNCGQLSFAPNLVLMLMYFIIVCSSSYFHARHRGEYIRETKWYHKLWMWFISYILLYIIIISWIYYNFFHSSDSINYLSDNFPWLTTYAISYTAYSIISTITFAYHSHYDNSALIQFVCLLCTVFPLGLGILTFFLFQNTKDIQNYQFGLFDPNEQVNICFNIDILPSLILTSLLILAFIHHGYVLGNVFLSIIGDKKYYLTHPHAYRGRVSNLSHSSVKRASSINSPPNYTINRKYVYKSEESESEHLNEQEIEINVQVPIYRHQNNHNQINNDNKDTLAIPIEHTNNIHDIDDENIKLNQSVDVRRQSTLNRNSVSYDL